MSRRPVLKKLLLLLAIVVSSSAFAWGQGLGRAAGPFTMLASSRTIVSLPETFFSSPSHLHCLMRSQPQPSSNFSVTLLCYTSEDPAPVPPPPPPPFEAPANLNFVAHLEAATGLVTADVWPCTEALPGVYAFRAALILQLDKAASGTGSIVITEDTTAPFDCADGMQVTGPVTLTPLAQSHDQDLDLCSDWEELGTAQAQGGLRDPFNFWDFMSVPTGSPLTRNALVDTADIVAISQQRFGSNDGNKTPGPGLFTRNDDPTTTPNVAITPSSARQNYHPVYDRSGGIPGGNAWNLNPADGNIGAAEIANAVAQFGHTCAAAP